MHVYLCVHILSTRGRLDQTSAFYKRAHLYLQIQFVEWIQGVDCTHRTTVCWHSLSLRPLLTQSVFDSHMMFLDWFVNSAFSCYCSYWFNQFHAVIRPDVLLTSHCLHLQFRPWAVHTRVVGGGSRCVCCCFIVSCNKLQPFVNALSFLSAASPLFAVDTEGPPGIGAPCQRTVYRADSLAPPPLRLKHGGVPPHADWRLLERVAVCCAACSDSPSMSRAGTSSGHAIPECQELKDQTASLACSNLSLHSCSTAPQEKQLSESFRSVWTAAGFSLFWEKSAQKVEDRSSVRLSV